MPVRDTSSLLKNGPRQGDVYTPGVIREVRNNNPSIVGTMMRYVATGAAEIYALPATITVALVKLGVLSACLRKNLHPSEEDLEVMVSGVQTGNRVESADTDINLGLSHYYIGLGGRVALATAEWYALAQIAATPGGQRAIQMANGMLQQLPK